MLYKHQIETIKLCKENNYSSGIIHHATGTGKSITGINIINNYIKENLNNNVYWICEQKFILESIFTNNHVIEYLNNIKKTHNIYNFSVNKNNNWYDEINKSLKPTFVIINRSYLITKEKYKLIKKNIYLIIHDECHSITNKTTQHFFEYLNNHYNFKVIGLSATPQFNISPLNKIIHTYSLYNALLDNNIVKPKIIWFNKEKEISFREIALEIKPLLNNLLYKKIIIWCGLIKLCEELYELWKEIFPDYIICIDTSSSKEINNYNIFKNVKEKAFLFCAAKHREGSDIKNLDGCIFLDKVSKRTSKTFVQCIGRVLRKEEKKEFGLIIDVKAKNAYEIVKRMNNYLNNSNDFPYDYSCSINDNTKIKTNILKILDRVEKIEEKNNEINSLNLLNDITRTNILNKLKREIPNNEYKERLNKELEIFIEKDLLKYINFTLEILELTKDIPHIIRGSSGSSLLFYLLGITNIDPIKYNIKFERFLNKYRNTLPDIDFDFPHNLRDDIFYRLEKKWPGKIARISNHVHYHEKSAKRQILRQMGFNKFIGKYEIDDVIKNKLSKEEKEIFNKKVKNIENTFSHYSLHCGGIVLYPDGIPNYLKHIQKSTNIINQITLSKYDIADIKLFKIDILSSRALSQLIDIDKELAFLDFENIEIDNNVMEIFCKGNNIGITLAESPLIRKAMIKIQPKNISHLAKVLAIIRPAAKQEIDKQDINELIFDDDAIDLIQKFTNVDNDLADHYRKSFIKNKYEIIEEMYNCCKNNNLKTQLAEKIKNLHGYSFCKSHAFSYAQLIYKLAYCKYYYPYKFWTATLKHCETSYKKWVHYYEANLCNVDFKKIISLNSSVYNNNKINMIYTGDHISHYKKYGIWNIKNKIFYPGCYGYIKNNNYYFRGIIAQTKVLDKLIIYFIGISPQKYIEVILNNKFFNKSNFQKYIIQGYGNLKDDIIISVQVKNFKFLS